MTIIKDNAALLEQEMTEVIRTTLKIKEIEAASLANKIISRWRSMVGGSDFYIARIDRKQRAQEIAEEFNGTNLTEVCKKHGVTKATVYRAKNKQLGGAFKV